MSERTRMPCTNEQGGREFFQLENTRTGIRITTPGALTHTLWTRRQVSDLRDALTALLGGTAR